ncbi:RNA polymerase sigma factor [Alloacidobacterium dinghuense]|uniref:RNA polymerase sigma factor n=1 Tax=Alloacidobacterium dinghuense TaxID=2763107 RepID=A0A7G8BDT9_9BACT|nr:RNA polymerase sigma factor [Alloacidobacterium dinghuense]QNI30709.1 RNA polymerase sigma factor [Alloacidobacterium dinghuense]
MSSCEAQAAGWFYTQPVLKTREDVSEIITALVAEYSTTLYRVAYSVTRNAAEAEDIVQETFLRVLRHQNKLGEIRDARVWLVRIAWNLALDRKRRSKSRPETEDIADLVRTLPSAERRADDAVISTQEHARVLALIDQLPAKERQALLLSALEELSTTEIASICSTTESSIRSRIFRARRELAELLTKERSS